MDFAGFRASLASLEPPPGLTPPLAALWWDAKGDWARAHEIVAADESEGAWVHAYLHRKEGDAGNAAYWYRRAGHAPATAPLETEWAAIARTLLGEDPSAG
jgi:hypothetical protein